MPASSCTGPLRRREFLRLGTLALGGLGLADLLAARAAARQADPDTSVILFWMWGGPSQFETYDPKPDAPDAYRGPFRPIRSAVPGLDLCELFPLQARLGEKIALIRSLHHTMSAHNDGSIEVLTGKTPDPARPHLDGPVRSSRFRHGGQPGAGSPARRHAPLCRHPQAAVHDPADLPGGGPFRRSPPATRRPRTSARRP